MEERICEVAWDEIKVSPFQMRTEINEEDLEELAASIRSVGLIQPPVVRRIEQQGKLLYYELIAGERRWRAAKRAGLTRLNVLVRNSNDEITAQAALIENIQRVDLNPIEMAEAYRKLLEIFQMKQEEVAEKVGKKRSTVANYLRLLSLPHGVRESLVKGKISMGHAKAILSLDSFELKEKLHDLIVQNQWTVREAEKESVKLAKLGKKRKKAQSPYALHLAELEERLARKFGTKVVLQHGREGKVVMHYYGLDDLDRLLNLLDPAAV